jgi:hypothetical protein
VALRGRNPARRRVSSPGDGTGRSLIDASAPRHQPDRLEQRRSAGIGRRHAARNLPRRGASGGVRRDRARQQISPRSGGAAADPRTVRAVADLGLVQRPPPQALGGRGIGGDRRALRAARRGGMCRARLCRDEREHRWRSASSAVDPAAARRRRLARFRGQADRPCRVPVAAGHSARLPPPHGNGWSRARPKSTA